MMALVVVTRIRLTPHTHSRFMCLTLHCKVIPPCPSSVVLHSGGSCMCVVLCSVMESQCKRFTMKNLSVYWASVFYSLHDVDWHNPCYDSLVRHRLSFAYKSQPLFPGDEDIPHVQHWQHQCRVQAEGGGEAGGEADGTLWSPGWPTDTSLPRCPGQHQDRRETRPTLQCQKNREDEGEGEWVLASGGGGEMVGSEKRERKAVSECPTCCQADLCLSHEWFMSTRLAYC